MNLLGKTGGSLTAHPTIFTPCSKYFLVPSGSCIKVIEVESGLIKRVLSSISGSAEITQILPNPLKEESQIVSCAVDGFIGIWDWQTGELVRFYRTKHAMHSMLIRSFNVSEESVELFTVSLRLKGPLGCNLPDPRKLFNYCGQRTVSLIEQVKLDLSSGGGFKIKQIFKTRGMARLALSPSGADLIFSSLDEVRFCRLNDQDSFEVSRTLKHSSTITRLMYHPSEPCVVLADRHGQIVMWYCLDESVSSYPQRTLHWHANEVTDLAFTSNGQYLLSGGEEAVLVLWQVESNLRQYLPRLGDPIHFVSVSADDRYIAVSTRDNVIHLVSLTSGSTLTVSRSIRGCKSNTDSFESVAAIGSKLLLPGNPGSLQIYDPIRDCVEGVLEVSPQNRLTGFKASISRSRPVLQVVRTALSPCGRWMVTVEQRNGRNRGDTVLTCRLKFWGLQNGSWVLLSMIERPHSDLINDMCVWTSPSSGIPFAASASSDGTFKLWSVDMRHGIWSCYHVGSYHDGCGGAASVTISPDCARLAVVYGASVTIWRVSSSDKDVCLVEVLMSTQSAKLKEARFLCNGSIVAWCPESGAFVYNRNNSGKLELSWHSPVSVKAPMAIHPTLPQFGLIVATEDGSNGVLTFESEGPIPIGFFLMPSTDFQAVMYVPSPESIRKVRPDAAEGHILVLLDAENGEFTLLSTENASRLSRSDFKLRIKPAQLDSKTEEDLLESSRLRARTLYSAIFDSLDGLTNNSTLDCKVQVVKHSMAELFTSVPQISSADILLPLVPSHILPPVGMLFSNYIQKVLKAHR